MTPTDEVRDKTYREADGLTRELYAGDTAGQTMRDIFDSYHLRPESYRQYALAFGDVILGLSTKEELPRALVTQAGISEKIAPLVAKELLEFLDSARGRAHPTNGQTAPAPTPGSSKTPQELPSTPTPPVPQPVLNETPATIVTPPQWSSTQRAQPTQNSAPAATDERPFYARTPNYAKPFVPPTPQNTATPPQTNTPPTPPKPRTNDPYHEPI